MAAEPTERLGRRGDVYFAVVTVSIAEATDTLPAASRAPTEHAYVEPAVSPVKVAVNPVILSATRAHARLAQRRC